MIISVLNRTNGAIADGDALAAIRAINRQIAEDFAPYWGFGATLRLEGKSGRPRRMQPSDMRGDAVLYLQNEVATTSVEGFHDKYFRGIPYGVVYKALADQIDASWTVTLSHEALELVADPEANLSVQGPDPRHPRNRRRKVYHWFEMCDAVQSETYKIDGIAVSNFVLPLYFTAGNEKGGRNDFLATRHGGKSLRSFGVNPGGYIGFFDPKTGKDVSFDAPDDAVAARRMRIKRKLKTGRGTLRRLRTLSR